VTTSRDWGRLNKSKVCAVRVRNMKKLLAVVVLL
jgi:hypothetical protein